MVNWQLKTPIAFLIFNRPDTTERVFEAIRQARPPKLLVVADGPRLDRPGEMDKCKVARAIIESVDWPCEVLRNFSDVNLGCRDRVSSGLDWVFSNVEEAIILEDDCLPDLTFFRFCEELLEKYRYDARVMMISGDNFQFGRRRTPYSYYFSRNAHIWGWASWRRAWSKYDVAMQMWPEIRDGAWQIDLFGNRRLANYWRKIYENVFNGKINTWDYQWSFSCRVQNGLVILPNSNLISNIGFYSAATHMAAQSEFANMQRTSISFPLQHPPHMIPDSKADAFVEKQMFVRPFFTKVVGKLSRLIKVVITKNSSLALREPHSRNYFHK